ncbi:MAG: amino acid permease, partial [Oxalobacteraceae bacterium]
IIISYSRQIFALARSGYLPHGLASVSKTRKVPVRALLAGAVFGIIALLSFDTSKLVILSTIGAVVVYIISMLALFRLRQTQPALPRSFKAPLYPYVPALALLLAVVTLIAMIYFYNWLSFLFFIGLVVLAGVFYVSGRYQKVKQEWQQTLTPNA